MSLDLNRRFQKTWWQLHSFALTPARLSLRLQNSDAPRVVATSIPKAGTNLLLRALCLHPRLYRKVTRTIDDRSIGEHADFEAFLRGLNPGQIVATHLRYSKPLASQIAASGARHLFIMRDPRDVAISTVFYVLREKNHFLNEAFARAPTFRDRLELAIRGDSKQGYQAAGERMAASAGWLSPPTHSVRFEDLVGAQGGGSDKVQLEELQRLFEFIGVDTSDAIVRDVASSLFSSNTRTFRDGRIGQWRDHFDEDLKSLFKQVAGEQLIRYGYEADQNW